MIFYHVVAALALGTVFIANYTDLKERIIPNRLTFPMIIAGIALYLGFGIYRTDLIFAIEGGLGAGITFAIGYGMWFIGGWAGGDVKLYTALGALLAGYSAPYMTAPYPFILTILFNGIICLAPVLFGYVLIKSIRTPGIGEKIINPIRKSLPESLVTPFVLTGGSVVGNELARSFNLGLMGQALVILAIIVVLHKIPLKIKAPIVFAMTGYGAFLYSFGIIEAIAISFLIAFGFRLVINSFNIIKKHVLQREVPITKLGEGMIPAETIYEKNGEVKRYKGVDLKKAVKKFFKNPKSFQTMLDSDRILADSNSAAGVSDEQIELLQKSVEEGELEDRIRIKEGLPFAPSFGLGVPIAIFYGDIYWLIIQSVGGTI